MNQKFNEFISSHNVDHSSFCVQSTDFSLFESEMLVPMGEQLGEYILTYGYLGYEFVEFLGINSKMMENSTMVKETKYLHKYFDKTNGLIAFENQGDGNYFLVDKNDNMYNYLSSCDELKVLNMKLFDYIMDRIKFVDEVL